MRRECFYPSKRGTRSAWRLTRATGLALLLAGGSPLAAGADVGAEAAEALVSQLYYEGLPYAEASAITPAGAAHLSGLLDDPEGERFHANIVLALGMAGHAGCVATLVGYAGREDASRAQKSARRMVPLALGYAAHRDGAALSWLRERAEKRAHPDRMMAITGLALAARPEADAILREIYSLEEEGGAGAATVGASTAQHLSEALAYSARLQSEGYEAVLGGTR